MSEFKKKLQELGNPAAHHRRKFSIEALVTKSDERNNLCSISFSDKDGYMSNKDNVPVRVYNIHIIDWFPCVGEWVWIEELDGNLIIVAKHEAGYRTGARTQTQNKEDIMSSSFTDTIAGFIL